MAFLRPDLDAEGVTPCAALKMRRDGTFVTIAGIVLMRQRPGTAKGVMFITIEDETGVANLVLWKDRIEAQRAAVIGATLMVVRGQLQREGDVIHVVVRTVEDRSAVVGSIGREAEAAMQPMALPARDFR